MMIIRNSVLDRAIDDSETLIEFIEEYIYLDIPEKRA
jgi:hypothetical protein